MISFVGKHIETKEIIRTPGKRISAKVVWKKTKFQVRKRDVLYDIDGWNDISRVKWIYALPTNTYHTPWHRKPYAHNYEIDKDKLELTLRFWGKYRHGMTIYGKLVDGVFHETKPNYNESDIRKTDKGEASGNETISGMVQSEIRSRDVDSISGITFRPPVRSIS